MNKGDRERLDETLNYLKSLTVPGEMSPGEVQQVAVFAANFVNQRYPKVSWHQRETTATHQFSQLMSLGNPYMAGDTGPNRKERRAIYLLQKAMYDMVGSKSVPPGIRTYGNPHQALVETMWKARFVWGQHNARTGPHQRWLNRFKRNPLQFLQTCRIRLSTPAPAVGNQYNLPDQNIQTFYLSYSLPYDRFEFNSHNLYNGCGFQATSVQAVHWTQVPNRGNNTAIGTFAGIHGTELGGGGVEMMITTQLTGCSICIKQHGGNIYMAHVLPKGPNNLTPIDVTVLARQLAGQDSNVVGGDFANAAGGGNPFLVFGPGYSNIPNHAAGYSVGGQAYVIGIFRAARWEVYCQTQMGSLITDAYQIF